jgi:NADPH:quinone reductase-like Zn-dependent oxidoreductase
VPGTLAEAIQILDLDPPQLRKHEVMVKVVASTINIDDLHVAEGTFYGGIPIGPRPTCARPVIPGSDLAGIVTAVGDNVRSFRVGQAVFGVQMPFHARGAWEESCAVDEAWLTSKPNELSFGTAAASGISGLVALYAVRALNPRLGARIVVVGATGGIGSMAVQLATGAGAEVIGVCGSTNIQRAYQLGCSIVLDYKKEAWDRALLNKTKTQVDGVLDFVGGREVEEAGRRVLRRDGVFVTVVGPKRFIGDRALGWRGVLGVLAHVGYRVVSSRIRGPRYVLTGPGLNAGRELAEVAKAAANGVLPLIDSTIPFGLEPMQQALKRAAAHQNNGRIVIQVGAGLD